MMSADGMQPGIQATGDRRRAALKALSGLTACAALLWLEGAAAADAATAAWPEKSITYVVPFTPGGSTDVVGRTLAQKLTERLGKSVVVENKPGAAGAVGAAFVAKAKPDGYTLFGGTISTHAINASLYKNLPYDPVKDFEPISLVAFLPNVLIVNPDLGVDSVADLIALLKKDPSKRNFASSGAGTSTHLAGELFAEMIGVKLNHTPYKGTPKPIIERLNDEIVKILQLSDVKEKLAGLGMELVGRSPEELARLMSAEIPRWGELVRKSGASTN